MTPFHDTPGPASGGEAGCPGRRGPRIEVVSAIGGGQTLISSFDDALWRCGVHNYNLIDLSSIIPPGSTVVARERCLRPPEEYGYRLYVVRAETRSDEPETIVAAGIGWLQWADGRGVFVEHARQTRDSAPEAVERGLIDHLHLALHDLCVVRGVDFAPERVCTRLAIGRVAERSTTALVLAVFQAEGWQ